MAAKKSAKRSASKKRPPAKGKSAKKKSAGRKRTATRRSKKSATGTAGLKRQARKGLKAARGGLSTALHAGEKTWETFKNTTAQVVEGVVEGVKDTLGGEPRPTSRRPNSP
jgi:hypothetical protein